MHRLVGAASGQLKVLKGGAAAVATAASPLADVLDTCLQPLAAAGGYAQVQTSVQHVWYALMHTNKRATGKVTLAALD